MSGTKKVNRYQPQEVRDALAALELARERLQLAADTVTHCLQRFPALALLHLLS